MVTPLRGRLASGFQDYWRKVPVVCLENRAWFALRRWGGSNSSTARGGVGFARAGDARRTAPASPQQPLGGAAADCIIFNRPEPLDWSTAMASPIASQLVVALGLLLAACAGKPTPYRSAQDGFGYSEQQTEENRYRVSFAGNSATSRQTVEDYLLYRAAELTVQTGHDWFQVVDRNTVQECSGYGGSPAFGLGVGSGSDVGVGLSFPMFGAGGSGSYSADIDILVQDGEKPQDDPDAYDAFSVISRLQPKVLAGGY
jgi:hypothetical protein